MTRRCGSGTWPAASRTAPFASYAPAPCVARSDRGHHARPERLGTVVTGCSDNSSWTRALSPPLRSRSRTDDIPGGSGVTAIALLAPDQLMYANGRTLSLYSATPPSAAPVLTIQLDVDVYALATHGTSVVAATRRGLVALNIPQ